MLFCKWTYQGFSFNYCDVLIGRLETIFELGSIAQKAIAITAAANLGYGHNRWYVMRRVMDMCDHSLDQDVAVRIAMEIKIDNLHDDFFYCAERISRSIESYHPIISAEIKTKYR
jgi:hypothetical protein